MVAAVVVLLAAVTATAFTIVLDGRRREAERARAQAEDLADLMLFDLHRRLTAAGRLDILADAARRAKAYYEDPFAGPRRNRVVALAHVAEVLRLEGDLPGATAALGSALAIARRLREEGPDAPLARHDLALTALKLGRLRLRAGDPSGAEAGFTEARDLLEGLRRELPENPKYAEDLATTRNRLGELRERGGDEEGAHANYDAASSGTSLWTPPRSGRWPRACCPSATRSWPAARRRRRSPRSARRSASIAGSSRPTRRTRPAAGTSPWRWTASPGRSARPGIHARAALAPAEEGREIRTAPLFRDPGNPKWQQDLASIEYRQGRLHQQLGEAEKARDLFAASAGRRRALAARDDKNAGLHRELAWTLLRLSEASEAADDLPQARELMEEATATHARATEIDPDLAEDQARFEAREQALKAR